MLEKMCRAIALVAQGDDTTWGRYRDEALAVLDAMREPTAEIVGAYLKTSVAIEKMDAGVLSDEHISDVLAGNPARWCRPLWQSMIDAARNGQ